MIKRKLSKQTKLFTVILGGLAAVGLALSIALVVAVALPPCCGGPTLTPTSVSPLPTPTSTIVSPLS